MTAGMVAQHTVVTLAVALSVAFVLQNRFPQAVRAARVTLALRLLRSVNPSWVRALGRRVAPRPLAAPGCGGCDGCGTTKQHGPSA